MVGGVGLDGCGRLEVSLREVAIRRNGIEGTDAFK
jgi:hypothetical protein